MLYMIIDQLWSLFRDGIFLHDAAEVAAKLLSFGFAYRAEKISLYVVARMMQAS